MLPTLAAIAFARPRFAVATLLLRFQVFTVSWAGIALFARGSRHFKNSKHHQVSRAFLVRASRGGIRFAFPQFARDVNAKRTNSRNQTQQQGPPSCFLSVRRQALILRLTKNAFFALALVCGVLEEGFGDGVVEAFVLIAQQDGGVVRLAHQHAVDGLVEANELAVYEVAGFAAFGVAG